MSLINIQYFGTTAIYKSLSSYFDGSGNPVTRDENLDGPIKFLFLPDSITTLGRSSFRLDYSFDSMLIYPKSFYLVSGTSSLQYLGFTSCLVNQIYELQPINFFNLCFLPFLSGIGMIQNNSAFTFYYHHDKFGTIDGQMIYPKKYALTPCSSGYYFSDGDSNNGEMGFGQKPIFAIGVIDMRDNLLNYTKK
jgi:hypothetical protein